MRPWYRTHPALFDEFKQALAAGYPSLHASIEGGRVLVRGTLFLRGGGIEIDHYQIETEVPNTFPQGLPVVREVGGRIPWIRDRHIEPENGRACVLLPDERHKYFPVGAPLIDFIRGPVENFFLSQTYFEKTGKWLSGQWAHGVNGIIDHYAEVLGTDNRVIIETCIRYLARKELKGHWECYCGGGKRLRECHLDRIKDMRSKVSQKTAMESLKKLPPARK